jgi:serine/threonine protein kinase
MPRKNMSARRFPWRVASESSLRGSSLSPELEADAARRLGALALVVAIVGATLWTVARLWDFRSTLGPRGHAGLVAVDIALSLGLWASIASGGLQPARALRIGLVYEVVQALLSSLGFHSMALAAGAEVRGWTPVAVWAIVFPLIVPAATRRVVLATLATAAMDPLGLWLNVVAGATVPPASALVHMFIPTAFACVLPPVAARIVYGLTVEVKRARELGSYRLVEKLGQGGMGEVWRAEHRMLARAAAIKLIRTTGGAGDEDHEREMAARFEREAQATAALRSPHTIAVYDYGVAADGTFHYVMELLEGFSLQALVDRYGPVPPERAVRFLRQACHSLAEAHAAGLVHRDVKPANLFVCRLGLEVDFVKVLDFGLVKARGPQAGGLESLTIQGTFAGTPAYMPPEMAVGAHDIDGRADIYAMGCVAYWLLAGERVFEGRNAMQMVIDHARTSPEPLSRRATQAIPDALERIVMRCLEKDPAARPASAALLSRELYALGIEERWSEERAFEWWRTHEPAGAGRESEVERWRGETRSRSAGSSELSSLELAPDGVEEVPVVVEGRATVKPT